MSENPHPPQAIEEEQRVLGAILKDPSVLDVVAPILPDGSYFYHWSHKIIYDAMIALAVQSEPVEDVTVTRHICDHHPDVSIQVSDLWELAGKVSTTINAEKWATTIAEKAARRKVISLSNGVAEKAYDGNISNEELVDQVERGLLSIVRPETQSRIIRLQDDIPQFIDGLLRGDPVVSNNDIIETRVSDLNNFLGGGFFKGDTVVIGGPPSMGKTSFAEDVCKYNAIMGKNSLSIILDESLRLGRQRIISGETGLSRGDIYGQTFDESQKALLREASTSFQQQKGSTWNCYQSSMTFAEVRSTIRRHHRQYGLDVVVIDYLSNLQPAAGMKKDRRYEFVTENSQLISALARDLNVVMIVVSQLNREYDTLAFNPAKGEYGIPHQAMLRDSGQIEQDANLVLFPWRPLEAIKKRGFGQGNKWYDQEYAKNPEPIEDAFIVIAKNKEGPTGRVNAKFHGKKMLFYTPYEGPGEHGEAMS